MERFDFNNYIHNNYILIQLKKDIRIKLLNKLFIKQKKIPDVVKGPVQHVDSTSILGWYFKDKILTGWTCIFNVISADNISVRSACQYFVFEVSTQYCCWINMLLLLVLGHFLSLNEELLEELNLYIFLKVH